MQLRLGSSTNNFWGYSKKPFGYSKNQVSATMKLFKKLVFCSSQIGSSSQLIWLKNRFDWNHTSLTQPRFFATTWPISKTKRHKDVRSTERPWDEQGFWCLKYWKWKMCTKTRCHGHQTLGRITNFCWFEIIGWFNSLESWHDWHVFFDRLVFLKWFWWYTEVLFWFHAPLRRHARPVPPSSRKSWWSGHVKNPPKPQENKRHIYSCRVHWNNSPPWIFVKQGAPDWTYLLDPFGTMEVPVSWRHALGIAM